jgi:hypothetical protein
MGPRTSLDECRNFFPHQDSIPGPSSPSWQVAILTPPSWPTYFRCSLWLNICNLCHAYQINLDTGHETEQCQLLPLTVPQPQSLHSQSALSHVYAELLPKKNCTGLCTEHVQLTSLVEMRDRLTSTLVNELSMSMSVGKQQCTLLKYTLFPRHSNPSFQWHWHMQILVMTCVQSSNNSIYFHDPCLSLHISVTHIVENWLSTRLTFRHCPCNTGSIK